MKTQISKKIVGVTWRLAGAALLMAAVALTSPAAKTYMENTIRQQEIASSLPSSAERTALKNQAQDFFASLTPDKKRVDLETGAELFLSMFFDNSGKVKDAVTNFTNEDGSYWVKGSASIIGQAQDGFLQLVVEQFTPADSKTGVDIEGSSVFLGWQDKKGQRPEIAVVLNVGTTAQENSAFLLVNGKLCSDLSPELTTRFYELAMKKWQKPSMQVAALH